MNNKDIYNYYMKRVYNEDIGFITTVAKTALEYGLSRGAADLASKYTGLDYGDPTTNDYKKNKDKDDSKISQKSGEKINLTKKFTNISKVPSSIKNTPKEYLKYIILEYMLASLSITAKKEYIEYNYIDDTSFDIFEKYDSINLREKLKSNVLRIFIKKTVFQNYPETKGISSNFNEKQLENILKNINTDDVKNTFQKAIENVFLVGSGLKLEDIEHKDIKNIYAFQGLEAKVFYKIDRE